MAKANENDPIELITQFLEVHASGVGSDMVVTKGRSNALAQKQSELEQQLKQVGVKHEGNTIIVPTGMSMRTAVATLLLQMQDQEREIAVSTSFDFPVPEGMLAFMDVLKREHGFVSATHSPGFFGMAAPPTFETFEIAPGVTESMPLNAWVRVPGIDGEVMASYEIKNETVVFQMQGKILGRSRGAYDRLVEQVRAQVKAKSIYRGHAIIADFREIESGSKNIVDYFPKFWVMPEDLDKGALIFTDETQELIETSIWTPIQHTALCRKRNIPLKRGILLEGPYGTGKTLTARVTAQLGTENDWTFIYLTDITKLAQAVAFARNYQPAIIFAEDGDQVLSGDRESDPDTDEAYQLNDILNTIDGIESKGTEVMVILTTNHVENINAAMLRPGRLDTIVSVREPDAKAAAKLVRYYAGDLLDPNEDLTEAGEALAGFIPAAIREAVERAKLGSIRRGDDFIRSNDIVIAAKTMQAHLELLKQEEVDERSDAEKAASIVGTAVSNAIATIVPKQQVAKPNGNGSTKLHTESA